ncbi:MAG: hypothetical protein ACM3N4_04550 [Nitrososphaerota archaeon]
MDDDARHGDSFGDPYHTQRANFDPTVADNMYPQPTRDYPPRSPYDPPAAPVSPNPVYPIIDPPTIHIPEPHQTVVSPPITVRGNGESAARMSLMLGIVSALIGWIPVCGIVALLPAAMGIFFGWRGRHSRQRNLALLGMLLSMLAIALAIAIFG